VVNSAKAKPYPSHSARKKEADPTLHLPDPSVAKIHNLMT
jgi:hypothetical protein